MKSLARVSNQNYNCRDSRAADSFAISMHFPWYLSVELIPFSLSVFQSKVEQPKNKFNLVPEYNSDDDSDDETPKPDKPLFPASTNNSCGGIINQITRTTRTSQENEECKSPQPNNAEPIPKKVKPSFASIITGGRSPQNETDLQKYIGETNEEPNDVTETTTNVSEPTESLPQKTFQRKRRIEFNASTAPAKRPSQTEDTETNAEPVKTETVASMRSKYTNFQKAGTEFIETESSDNNDGNPEDNQKPQNEIVDQQFLLEAKLNFLSQGRADVSPVQVIQIQLQVS